MTAAGDDGLPTQIRLPNSFWRPWQPWTTSDPAAAWASGELNGRLQSRLPPLLPPNERRTNAENKIPKPRFFCYARNVIYTK
jgi:hypothetical protein